MSLLIKNSTSSELSMKLRTKIAITLLAGTALAAYLIGGDGGLGGYIIK